MIEIKLRKGEPIEKALRRLKRKMNKEGIFQDLKRKRYYRKPSDIRHEKKTKKSRR